MADTLLTWDIRRRVEDFELQNPSQPKLKIVQQRQINSKTISDFYELCQREGFLANVDIIETSPCCFAGRVEVGTIVIEEKGPFRSKRDAKEAVCGRAIRLLQLVPCEKRELLGISSQKVSSEVLDASNWIGTLQSQLFICLKYEMFVLSVLADYVQQNHLYAMPKYTEYQTESQPFKFACTLQVPGISSSCFGSKTDLYPSKKEARKAAAREAVLWLRSQGQLATPASSGDCKSMLSNKLQDVTPLPSGTDHMAVIKSVQHIGVDAKYDLSLPEQVRRLALALGFTQPAFEFQPCVHTHQGLEGFVNVEAYFTEEDVRREPRLKGPVGRIESVYSKKTAKEMCCQEVLRLLEENRESRIA